ncbi:hypothetical protein [Falsirhodobacter halotolerans]|uniref:hypothetical protein n=1 Tax=Falsirhodobacter halotolerans TaxID=1146892 RepID=UPI001FD148B8|nr:hypothetical protein [Falsirhodobacter halotolerans]MCJ8140159.1 hypothetical protein [Falsirhodobacter halotolerans]
MVKMSVKRIGLVVSVSLIAGALAACAPAVPDSSYQSYMRNQAQNPIPPAYQTGGVSQGFSTQGALDAINNAESGGAPAVMPSGERPRGNAPMGIREESGEMTAVRGNTGMSNENSFEAVSAERSIAEDAAVIAQNRSQYVQVQPTALPQRSSNTPNIVAYALQTSHPRGQQMFGRSSIRFSNSAEQCAKYGSPDLAQIAFLEGGGPQRDRNNLDPDGDGYACSWDPAPFRAGVR